MEWSNSYKKAAAVQTTILKIFFFKTEMNCNNVNTVRPRQNGRHLSDNIFKCIFFNENIRISIDISLKCVPKGSINNIPSLVQVIACRRPGDKPLSEPKMIILLKHICVTQPQWVNLYGPTDDKSSCYIIEVASILEIKLKLVTQGHVFQFSSGFEVLHWAWQPLLKYIKTFGQLKK